MWFVVIIGVVLLFFAWSFAEDVKNTKKKMPIVFCDSCGDPYFVGMGCGRCAR